jgi:hypothetical protein
LSWALAAPAKPNIAPPAMAADNTLFILGSPDADAVLMRPTGNALTP